MRYAIYGLVIVLIILHQDNWLWDDKRLIFGFMPISLLYQAGISMGAAFVWFLATKFAWPHHLEKVTQEPAAQETGETE